MNGQEKAALSWMSGDVLAKPSAAAAEGRIPFTTRKTAVITPLSISMRAIMMINKHGEET